MASLPLEEVGPLFCEAMTVTALRGGPGVRPSHVEARLCMNNRFLLFKEPKLANSLRIANRILRPDKGWAVEHQQRRYSFHFAPWRVGGG